MIFPSVTGKVLSDATPWKLVREQGVESVPYGCRSSFSDKCGVIGQPRGVAEASLAHSVKSKVEATYARSDLLKRRRTLMRAGRIISQSQSRSTCHSGLHQALVLGFEAVGGALQGLSAASAP